MTLDLAALKAALEAATQGEWHVEPVDPPEIYSHPPGERHGTVCEIWSGRTWDRDREEADAAYILATQPRAMREIIEEVERLREALRRLHAWSRCFVEDTPITAETLWREFPAAVKAAKAALAGDRHD